MIELLGSLVSLEKFYRFFLLILFVAYIQSFSSKISKCYTIVILHIKLILFENLFKPRQLHLAVGMLLTSSVLSTTSKQCFELTSSVLSTTSKQYFELTSSVLSTTSKHCFEQPAASFLVCSLIFIEYSNKKGDYL